MGVKTSDFRGYEEAQITVSVLSETCTGQNSTGHNSQHVAGAHLRRSTSSTHLVLPAGRHGSDDPADTSRQRGHGPSGDNLFPAKTLIDRNPDASNQAGHWHPRRGRRRHSPPLYTITSAFRGGSPWPGSIVRGKPPLGSPPPAPAGLVRRVAARTSTNFPLATAGARLILGRGVGIWLSSRWRLCFVPAVLDTFRAWRAGSVSQAGSCRGCVSTPYFARHATVPAQSSIR